MNRFTVDWAACDAHGVCALWAPDLVRRDEWGYPLLAGGPVPPELVPQARAAARACPALALHLSREPSPRRRRD
jgi:ferredoxin